MKEVKEGSMEEYNDEEAEVLSLSDLKMEDEDTTGSKVVNTTFYQDFFGFSSEECKNSPVKPAAKQMEETNPAFRSNSGSFRHMRFKIGSRTGSWRSRSLSVMASKSKSRWQVFMSGFGSGRFPAKMDLVDIKTRQLRSQSTAKVSENVDIHVATSEDNGGGPRIRKKVWWRLVDVLGCGGGYERNNMVVV